MAIVKKTIGLTEKIVNDIEQIQEEMGFPTFSAVITWAIMQARDGGNAPSSNVPQAARPVGRPSSRRTPEEYAAEKKARKEAEANLFKQEKLKILEKLGGRLVHENGFDYGVFYTYNYDRRYEQKRPLRMIEEHTLDKQYVPSRERVEEMIKAGEVKW